MRFISTTHANLKDSDIALKKDAFESLRVRLRDAEDDYSYKSPFSFLAYLSDTNSLDGYKKIVEEKSSEALKTVFVIGIGGANLGAKAVIDALPRQKNRNIVFLDTLYVGEGEEIVEMVGNFKSLNEFVVIVISKSGKTLETLESAELLVTELEKKFGSVSSRLVVVTTPSSPLFTWASVSKITTISIPHAVSGRYSVFSPVGVIPLLFAKVSVDDLFAGATESLHSNIGASIGPAFQASIALDQNTPEGVHGILDLFFFSQQLETLGKWQRQLSAESLGKENTIVGKALNRSLTPTVSIGTTDLHSMLQLYLAQPQGRITWFTTLSKDRERSIGLPQEFKALLPGIDEASPEHLLSVIYTHVAEAYQGRGMPYLHSEIEDLSARDLGYYMMNAILVTLGLAQLWNVDPFDQPNVEEYKEAVRKELSNNS
jgi:glucose-6-phosphate isomerase